MSVRVKGGWRKIAFTALVARDGAQCAQCQEPHKIIWRRMGMWGGAEVGGLYTKVIPTSNLEVDHRVALHIGGDNEMPNLWLLCRDCHRAKTSAEQSRRLKRLFAAARA